MKHTESSVEWKCFKEIMLQGGSLRQVHIENFGQISACFGPLTVLPGGDTTPGGFLHRIRQTMEKPYFFGPCSMKFTITQLRYKPAGAVGCLSLWQSYTTTF